VVAISQHPTLRPGPALVVLGRLEAVLRELRLLLERGQDENLCAADSVGLHWENPSLAETYEREFQFSVWEGTRAFSEGNMKWAGLCWQSALLHLEHLVWCSDLDVWTTFIRCIVRLQRFGAAKVGLYLLQKLQGLRRLLPLTVPHRPFLYALTDVSFDELANGGLFILEAKLRNIELLWPGQPHVYTTYQIDLAEERFYHGYDNVFIDTLSQEVLNNLSIDQLSENTAVITTQVSKSMILLDYPTAEGLVQSWIDRLEHHRGKCDHELALGSQLAIQYEMLGRIQYRQEHDDQARTSYTQALNLHNTIIATGGSGALQAAQVHRIYTLLEWLTSQYMQQPLTQGNMFGMRRLKLALEDDVQRMIQAEESRPIPNHEATQSGWPKPKHICSAPRPWCSKDKAKPPNIQKLPMFASVDKNKIHSIRSNTLENPPTTYGSGRGVRGRIYGQHRRQCSMAPWDANGW